MKKFISLLTTLITVITLTPLSHAKEFKDIPASHLAHVAINYLSDAGILKGYADGTFQPDKLVNRVEALKVILEEATTKLSEDTSGAAFKDTDPAQWYGKYLATAKGLGIVNGNPDGTFAPSSQVKRAAFMKMLLETNHFKKDKWGDQDYYKDVPKTAWYAPYMNYAGKSGLILPDVKGDLKPDQELTRAEVAEILYVMRVILHGRDNQFLLGQSEAEMTQIEIFVGAKNVAAAKRASELAVDMTQQALKNVPTNTIVLGAAKLAKAYGLVVDAFIAGIQKKMEDAKTLANQAIVKADEAIVANKDITSIAQHIKDRAKEILGQLK